jgi:hypothetical protein
VGRNPPPSLPPLPIQPLEIIKVIIDWWQKRNETPLSQSPIHMIQAYKIRKGGHANFFLVRKFMESFCNRKSAKFLRCASPQIENPRICHDPQIAHPQIRKEKCNVSDPDPCLFVSNTFFSYVSIL